MMWLPRCAGRVVAALAICAALAAVPTGGARATALMTWSQVAAGANDPAARVQYGMTSDSSGSVYIFGGRGAGGVLGDFWIWTPAAHWRRLNSDGMPNLIEPHLAADADGNVYEFGGIGMSPDQHLSEDGHSFGLYQYQPSLDQWLDLTSTQATFGADWPQAREDHGFAYDPAGNALWVFAGEGDGLTMLNDMWRFDITDQQWQQVTQHYNAPGNARIDAREIYNVSYDGNGGFYLFGGADLVEPSGVPLATEYVNDLWRFDIVTARWSLIAGRANRYDPTMPMPRHYYAQACDADGNFYILGGFISATANPPYFSSDQEAATASVVVFQDDNTPTGVVMYGLSDFWQFNAGRKHWVDMTDRLGNLGGEPFIPYNMVLDQASNSLISFGGYHYDKQQELAPSSGMWTFPLAAADDADQDQLAPRPRSMRNPAPS